MTHKFYSHNFAAHRRLGLFCLVWTLGLLCGGFIAGQAGEAYLLLMRRAVFSPVSITGLLASALFPFLCVFFAVYISRPKLIYCICFLKACSFSFTGFSVLSAFGSGGWLVRLLLQFTDSGALLLLSWFALVHLDGSKERLRANALVCGLLVICLGCLDYCYVSPFLAMLV